jgi:hypothetical protein
MTPDDWDACTEPQKMLSFLRESGRASERKLRLFGVACCRRIAEVATYRRARAAVEVAERYADGLAAREELLQAGEAAWKGARWTRGGTRSAAVATSQACSAPEETHQFLTCFNVARNYARNIVPGGKEEAIDRAECGAIAATLRDIFGPAPFRPVTLDPTRLTPEVLSLARASYDERLPSGELDAERLAVLADALLDAGCDDVVLLQHLRGEGPHWRGCFAVDAVLSKG